MRPGDAERGAAVVGVFGDACLIFSGNGLNE